MTANHLRDLVASALRGDGEWDSLSESQKALWRADADRAIKALQSAPGYAQNQTISDLIDEMANDWLTPNWHKQFRKDCEKLVEAAIAALPAPAGVEVTVEQLDHWLFDQGMTLSSNILARNLLSRFTILAKPAQEGGL